MSSARQAEPSRLFDSSQSPLSADADLMDAVERRLVDTRLQAAAAAQDANDADTVQAAVQALSAATEDFAARLMDRGIRAALAGRKLDEVARSEERCVGKECVSTCRSRGVA